MKGMALQQPASTFRPTFLSALIAGLAVATCAPATAPQQPAILAAEAVPVPAPPPAPEPPTILGQWDVVTFEGYAPRRLSGTRRAAYADFRDKGVSLRIECNYSGRAGTVSDGRFVAGDNSMAGQTVMSCGPERNAREGRYFTFFEKNPTVEHLGPNQVRLRSGTAELVLARPEVNRMRFIPTPAELQGKWRMVELARYLPGGGYTGGGLSEVPGRITFSGDRLYYSRCAQYAATVRLEAGNLKRVGGASVPAGRLDCPELSAPPTTSRQPTSADILRLLHADPAVERTDKDSILISTAELGLLLTKAPCERLEQSNDHRRTWVTNCASPE